MISVCMTTFNGALHLAEQMESVLSQLGGNDELVIADDGSTDSTLNMIRAWADNRIRLLPSVGRLGVVANFERALLAARGDFIFLCDQDDVWLPNKCVVFMEALGSADMVVSDCGVTDEALKIRVPSFFQARGSGPGTLRNLWRNSCLGCCMAFRREILCRALPFPAGIPMHDTWIGLVANATGTVCFCPEVTLMYRRHGGNFSPTSERSTFSQWAQFGHRFKLGTALVARLIKLKMSSLKKV